MARASGLELAGGAAGNDPLGATTFGCGERLRTGLEALLRSRGFRISTSGGGPVFQLSFMERPARNYRETLAADKSLYSDFVLALLDEGVLVLPDGRWYLSAAHSDADIETTLAAAERAVQYSEKEIAP